MSAFAEPAGRPGKPTMRTRKLAIEKKEPVPKKSKAQVAADVLRYSVDHADNEIRTTKRQLDEFAADVAKDPVHALEWADSSRSAYVAAGRMRIAETVKYLIDAVTEKHSDEFGPPMALEVLTKVRANLYSEMVCKARFTSMSTSQSSNRIEQCINAARAEWVEKLDRYLDVISEAGE